MATTTEKVVPMGNYELTIKREKQLIGRLSHKGVPDEVILSAAGDDAYAFLQAVLFWPAGFRQEGGVEFLRDLTTALAELN